MSTPITKFHTSLNVSDLAKSVAFYQVLFGCEPAKRRADYAKFELTTPPVVLSLIPKRSLGSGTLNHVGLSLPNAEELVKIQARLEAAGIRTQREEGVECCYALQTKFWVADPDRTLWEFYVFHEDIDEHGDGSVPQAEAVAFAQDVPKERVTWQHHLGDPVPERLPFDDCSVHEIALEGTCNQQPPLQALQQVLAEAIRVLRPGGQVSVHGLGGSRPWPGGELSLPGPAARVQHVPGEAEPVGLLRTAGFVDVRFDKLSPKAYFVVGGIEMREILITGRKPGHRPRTAAHQAIYLGPLAEVTDDYGNRFPRGQRVALNIHDWQALSNGSAAAQFLLLKPETAVAAAACHDRKVANEAEAGS